jgi:acetyl esterase/lipase
MPATLTLSLTTVGSLWLSTFLAPGDMPNNRPVKRGGNFAVEVVRDVAYYTGADADPVKHKLDLYLPQGARDFPVLFFVHGGGWHSGDKRYLFDVYGNIARTFARNGIGTVVTNYRLSPKVRHPAHAQDVARAFAWTYRNIARYGGRADEIFVSGHSAGGHLVSLLATDPEFLQAEGLKTDAIRGVLALSGVYDIPPGKLFASVFTDDMATRRSASPLAHVNGRHPPFLIVYADGDFPTCDKMSEAFCEALRRHRCEAETVRVDKRDHISIVVRLVNQDDPATQAMLDFIARHSDLKLTADDGATVGK